VLVATALIGGRDARLLPSFELQEWRRMVGKILPYSVTVVLAVVYFQVAQVMMSLLSTATQTGYFGVSFRVLISCTLLPGVLVSPALPLLARAARDDAARFDYASRRLAETMMLAGCACALALFLGARFAVDVVAGSGFGHSVEVLRILAVALLGTFVTGGRGYALLSLDRLRAMLFANGLALIVVLACGVPLISAYGARGAAIAMVAAELTLALGYEWSLSRLRPVVRYGVGFVVKAAAATMVAGAATTLLGLPSVAAAALGLTLYIALLLALGIVPVEVRTALLRRHRPAA
jgi:O-antigen/teichoic acid export membrane protein